MKHIATNADPLLLGLDAEQVWDTERAFGHLKALEEADSKRTTERRLNALGLLPRELTEDNLLDERDQTPNRLVLDWAIEQARKRRDRVLFAQLTHLPNGKPCLHANDARGARFWVPLQNAEAEVVQQALTALQLHIDKPVAVFPHGALVGLMRDMDSRSDIHLCPQAYRFALPADLRRQWSMPSRSELRGSLSPHLRRLEAESIHNLREAIAEAQSPVMQTTLDKNSSVMLHLARKAFYPATPPFALLHVDTGWAPQEMIAFRDFIASASGMDMLVHAANNETEGLRQAMEHYKFDVVLADACSDEEKSQHPKLWNLTNTCKSPGESVRVLPLSNWTELDIWHYICQQNIPIVPLYLAKPRAVVVRAGMIMMVDDERCRLLPGEAIQIRKVRLRDLGCYPLTGAVESEAEMLEDILLEFISVGQTSTSSIKKKKQEGYL